MQDCLQLCIMKYEREFYTKQVSEVKVKPHLPGPVDTFSKKNIILTIIRLLLSTDALMWPSKDERKETV